MDAMRSAGLYIVAAVAEIGGASGIAFNGFQPGIYAAAGVLACLVGAAIIAYSARSY